MNTRANNTKFGIRLVGPVTIDVISYGTVAAHISRFGKTLIKCGVKRLPKNPDDLLEKLNNTCKILGTPNFHYELSSKKHIAAAAAAAGGLKALAGE